MLGHDDWVESVFAIAQNAQWQRTILGLEGLVTKAVALVGDLEKLVSINFFRRRFGGLTAGEICIHFSLQHGFDKALGEGTYGHGEGFGTQGAARCSKLGNVLFDVVIEGIGGLLTRIAFGVRAHWVCPCQANQKSPFAVEQALLDGCQWFTFLTDQRRAIVDITPVTLSPIETVISASSGR